MLISNMIMFICLLLAEMLIKIFKQTLRVFVNIIFLNNILPNTVARAFNLPMYIHFGGLIRFSGNNNNSNNCNDKLMYSSTLKRF